MITRYFWSFLESVKHKININYAQSALALFMFAIGNLKALFEK